MTTHGSTNSTPAPGPLRLVPMAGPEIEGLRVEPGSGASIGRSQKCDLVLHDGSVSRRHARIASKGGRWMLIDEGSRHGTMLNGTALRENTPSPIYPGDQLRIGPWIFGVRVGEIAATSDKSQGHSTMNSGSTIATVVSGRRRGEVVEAVEDRGLGRLAQQRLDLLIRCAAKINVADNELEMAESVLDAALEGSGFPRAAMIRHESGAKIDSSTGVSVIASRSTGSSSGTSTHPAAPFSISASLIAEAARGRPAKLGGYSDEGPLGGPIDGHAESVASLKIHSALCVPIMVGEAVQAFLYLDARSGEASTTDDATGFCVALARICGLAAANIMRASLEERQAHLEEQLDAAREAQQLIVPPSMGVVGGLRYAVVMKPGLVVAGDLFDIIEFEQGRVAVFLGDVTGEGVGAGIMMASAQSFLHAQLVHTEDPETAINATNRYLADHSPKNRFVSMWVGVFDERERTLTYVDAGHGHWLYVENGAEPKTLLGGGGIPAAIDPDVEYRAETVDFGPGDRLVLFSDGVVEQTGGEEGEMFGMERAIEVVRNNVDCEADAGALLRTVLKYAGREQLDDDTTIAAVQWGFSLFDD